MPYCIIILENFVSTLALSYKYVSARSWAYHVATAFYWIDCGIELYLYTLMIIKMFIV